MHDNFRKRSYGFSEIFKMSAAEKEKKLYEEFSSLADYVLQAIITNESNLFQSMMYKLYLFKLSLID